MTDVGRARGGRVAPAACGPVTAGGDGLSRIGDVWVLGDTLTLRGRRRKLANLDGTGPGESGEAGAEASGI